MTAKLKFKLALRVAVDPVTIFGAGFIAGLDQAGNTPDYQQGAKGYGQRFGAVAADGFSDIMIQNTFYPQSNRCAGLVFGHFALDTAERAVSSLAQEFLFRRLTPKAKHSH